MKYYYSLDNKPAGPITLEELHTLFRNGVITLNTLIVPEGGSEWTAYSTLNPPPKDAGPVPPAMPTPAPAVTTAATPATTTAPSPTPAPSAPSFASTPLRPNPVPQPGYKNLVLISYILLGATALVSVIPVLGCFSWVMFIPVLIATVVLGILILNRGGQRDGIIILALSIFVLPAFTFVAPIITTAIFGQITGLGNKSKTTQPVATDDPADPALPAAPSVSPPRTQPASDTAGSAQEARNKAITHSLDQFLKMLNAGQYEQSYDAASPSFRVDVTKAAYAENMRKNRAPLGQATDHQIKSMDTNTDLETGAKTYVIPVASKFTNGDVTETVTIVQDPDKQYRVSDYSITMEIPAPAASGSKDVPNAATAKQMVNNTMVNFKNAINSGNFEPFYRTQLSELWKKQTTPTKLTGNFQTFIDQKIDLSPIFFVQPVLDPAPAIDSNGMLILKGRYTVPKEKVTVHFDLAYSKEAKWGLSRINVQLKPISD